MQIAALLQDGALPFGRTMDYRKRVAAIYLLGFFIDLINMFITSAAIPAGAPRAAYYGSKKVAIASLPTFYYQCLRRCFICVLRRRIDNRAVLHLLESTK